MKLMTLYKSGQHSYSIKMGNGDSEQGVPNLIETLEFKSQKRGVIKIAFRTGLT